MTSSTAVFAANGDAANPISLIPTEDKNSDTTVSIPANCVELTKRLSVKPYAGDWLALKVKCGRMTLDDGIYYLRYMLGFVFNIIGTLGVLAIIRAGYLYIWAQKKEDAYKAIQAALLGIVVAFASFTIARVIFTFFQVF